MCPKCGSQTVTETVYEESMVERSWIEGRPWSTDEAVRTECVEWRYAECDACGYKAPDEDGANKSEWWGEEG